MVSKPLSIALQYIHQNEHVEDFREVYDQLPSFLSDYIKLPFLQEKIRRNWLKKEARAYGTQAIGSIYAYGLIPKLDSSKNQATANLLHCGGDIRSSCWEAYVDRTFLSRSGR